MLVYQAVLWVLVSTGTHLPRLMQVRFSCPWIHPCPSACMCCEAFLAELQATHGRQLIVCIWPLTRRAEREQSLMCFVNVLSFSRDQ